jgi:TRAP-type mannitol/chloroaromatic compound transport system permease small subunit
MSKILKIIDAIGEYSGRAISWLCAFLVLVLFCETFLRYVFNAPTIWAHVTSMNLFGTIVLMGLAYTELHEGHLRIDVLYKLFPLRVKAILDLAGAVFLLFPLIYLLLKVSVGWAVAAWVDREVWTTTIWRPSAIPFRMIVAIGIFLYGLQSVATFIRNILRLREGSNHD